MISVLLIEDDPMVREVNKQFVERVRDYQVISSAPNGVEGLKLAKKLNPDLVMIDIYMPDMDGLATLKKIRAEGLITDVIAITAAKDVETVRHVLQNGVFDYIVKPFKFERLKKSLENYRKFQSRLLDKTNISQSDLDGMLFQMGSARQRELPKGLNRVTLERIRNFLLEQSRPVSAEEVAEGTGIARVTARRYLDHLEKGGIVTIHIEYGGIGRPTNRYLIIR
ncbi:two-component system response regulator DctR [Kroppenstedtia sanguinis]|uniref:Transcriptional regulatory protein n=1 Tax=Kroppenstedtia sanguinis TaxID=1380684 RepID=A0ABW4C505_9BACL